MVRERAWSIVRAPARLWWGSLPLRVVATTLALTMVVLVAAGFLLIQQATDGLYQGKVGSATAEASVALDNMEANLRSGAIGQASGGELLTRVAAAAVQRGLVGGQYHVVVEGPVSEILTPGLNVSSVPSDLRLRAAEGTDGLLVTPTLVRYNDGTGQVPGIAVGAILTGWGTERYPVYFIFPLTQEQATLQILQQALLTTASAVALLLGIISLVISQQVVRPIRSARQAAESLADGNLEDRMPVRGTDDLARLAVSMNNMASQLQQRIRQLEDLSGMQQRFVSDVSHELRTPLTTVRMAAEVLHDGRDAFPAFEARSAALMHRELDRFEELLGDLLEISRFDAGAAVLTPDEVDISQIVTTEVDSLRHFADSKDTELRLTVPGPLVVDADGRRVSRVVRNLLTNAIEHSEARPVDITVVGDDKAVAVSVRDHGVGFRASEAQQVFNRFWRADPARARTVGGTGLGLSISLEDVRLHGGWLNAWGRPKQGAHFRMTLPRRQGEVVASSPMPLVPVDAVPHLRRVADLPPPPFSKEESQ